MYLKAYRFTGSILMKMTYCEWVEVYKKYKDRLAELLEKGMSLENLHFISKEFLEIMEKECQTCQANRMHCILMPRCGSNRPFLSMLIEIDVEKKDLPSFCYSQLLKEVQMAFKSTKQLRDASIPLGDFLKSAFRSYRKIRDLLVSGDLEELSKVISKEPIIRKKKVLTLSKNSLIYFIIDGLIFYVDMNKEIVRFNPYETPITLLDELEAFIELLAMEADMKNKIEKEIGGILSIDLYFPMEIEEVKIDLVNESINNIFQKYRTKLGKFFDHIYLYVSHDGVHLILDLEIGDMRELKHITPKIIIETFKALKKLKDEILKNQKEKFANNRYYVGGENEEKRV